MPFVDINAIAPKVTTTTASDPATSPSDVKEIKGPALSAVAALPTAGAVPAVAQPQRDLTSLPPVAPAAEVVLPAPSEPLTSQPVVPQPAANISVSATAAEKKIEPPIAPKVSEPALETILPPSFSIELPAGGRKLAETPEVKLPTLPNTPVMQSAADSLLEVSLPTIATNAPAEVTKEALPPVDKSTNPVANTPEDLQLEVDQMASVVKDLPAVKTETKAEPVLPKESDPLDISAGDVLPKPEVKEPLLQESVKPVQVDIPATSSVEQPNLEAEVKPPVDNPIEQNPSLTLPQEPAQTPPAPPLPEVKMEGAVEREYDLDTYLNMAVEMGASDIHFRSGYRVTIRLHGELKPLPSSMVLTEEHMEKYTNQMFVYKGIEPDKEIMDFDMAYQLPSNHRFRVNIFKQQRSYGLVFRLIPNKIPTIKDLGLPSIVLDFARLPYGLVLVTGATGSGKSTTLASIINHINMTQAKHIITIEDPVEYVYSKGKSLIDQREILQDTKSWSIALRSALREDPNVLLIGEMRDYETIASAIRIAETGQLVFATLHTNNAAQTVERVIDVFPEQQQSQIRVQLANTLQAVISQRLVPTADGTARRPAVEILVANEAVRTAIRDNKTHQINNIIQTGADVGMISLEKSLVQLVRDGQITVEKAQEYSLKPEEILTMLSKTS